MGIINFMMYKNLTIKKLDVPDNTIDLKIITRNKDLYKQSIKKFNLYQYYFTNKIPRYITRLIIQQL